MSMLPVDLKLSDDQESSDRPRNYMEELEKIIPKDRFSKEEYAVIEDKLLILKLLSQEQFSKRNRAEAFIQAQKISLETLAQENKMQILSLQKELSSAKAELEINRTTIADLQQKLKEDNKKHQTLKDSNDALTGQVLTLERESSSVKAELEIKQITIGDLQQKLEKENKNNKTLKDSNDALTGEVQTLKRDLMSVKLDSDDTRRTIEDLKQHLEGSTKQVNRLKHQNHQKFVKLDAIRIRILRIKARLQSMDEEMKLKNQLRSGIDWQWYFTDTNYYTSPLYYGEVNDSQSKTESIPVAVAAVIADFATESTTRESLETVPEVLFSQDTLDSIVSVTETLFSKAIVSEASSESETLPYASDTSRSVSKSASSEIELVPSVPEITSSVSKVEFKPQSMQKTETFGPEDVISTQIEVTSPNEKMDAEVSHFPSKEETSKAVSEVQFSTKKVETSANEVSFLEKQEIPPISEAILSETTLTSAEIAVSSTTMIATVEAKSASIPIPRPRSFILKCGEIDALTMVKPSNPDLLKTKNLSNTLEPPPEEEVLNTKLIEMQALSLTPLIAPRLRHLCEDEIDIRVKSTGNETRPLSLSSTHVPSPRPRRRAASVLIAPLAETDALIIEVNTSKTETTTAAEVSNASVVDATVSSAANLQL